MSILHPAAYFLGLMAYMFFVWKRLKEDYVSSLVFAFAFYIAILMTIFMLTTRLLIIPNITLTSSLINIDGTWFWMAILGAFAGFVLSFIKVKIRFYQGLEAATMGLLLWLGISAFMYALSEKSFTLLGGSFFVVSLFLFFHVLEGKYKSFAWYRSGRVGFSGLFIAAVFFLSRGLVATFAGDVVSFVGKTDIILSLTAAILYFIALFRLSKSKL